MFLFKFFWIIPVFVALSLIFGITRETNIFKGMLLLLITMFVGALFGNLIGLSMLSLLSMFSQNTITVDTLIKAIIFCSIGGALAAIGCFFSNEV